MDPINSSISFTEENWCSENSNNSLNVSGTSSPDINNINSFSNQLNLNQLNLNQHKIDEFLNSDLNMSGIELCQAYSNQNNQINIVLESYELLSAKCEKTLEDNERLNYEAIEAKKEIWDLWDKIYHMDKDLSQFQQYGRRENIEISGIPESVHANFLEDTVINILRRIGVHNLKPDEIIGCHRLKKINKDKPANVIVRFLNRKRAHQCLRNRPNLRWNSEFPNLFIVENLCPKYRSIFDACNELKKKGKISHVWSYNGTVHFKTSNNLKDRGIKIFHISDLDEHFPMDNVSIT